MNDLEYIKRDISDLKDSIRTLQSKLSYLEHQEVDRVKNDVYHLESKVDTLEGRISSLENDSRW